MVSAERIYALRQGRDGIRKIRAALRELQVCGYLERRIVRGPRGRIATELHFYDVSAGRTDCTVTGSRLTDTPVTDRPVTDRPVGVQSLRTPSTKTEKNTDHKHPLSLGAELPQLDGLADDEREPFAHHVIETAGNVRAPRPYLRSIPAADLAALLADWRGCGRGGHDRPPWCGECSDETRRQIDTPGGVARCPKCHPLSAGRGMLEPS